MKKTILALAAAGLAPVFALAQEAPAPAPKPAPPQAEAPDPARFQPKTMFGDRPNAWSKKLNGDDRIRAIINVMTRMRFCDVRGRIDFDSKGAPGTQKPGFYPWFEVPGHSPRELPIVCGHWSTLGLFQGIGIHSIDTGAVWGGRLTALQLGAEPRIIQVDCEARAALGARKGD